MVMLRMMSTKSTKQQFSRSIKPHFTEKIDDENVFEKRTKQKDTASFRLISKLASDTEARGFDFITISTPL